MNVCPTNSGVITHARAQVLIGSRFFAAFIFSTFARTFGSTYGPFLTLRLIAPASRVLVPPALAPADDELVGQRLALARLAALAEPAERRARVPAAAGAPFAA